MSLFDNLKHDIKKGAEDIKNIGDDLDGAVDGAVDRAVNIAKSGYADVERDVQQIILAGTTAFMDELKDDALKTYGVTITNVLQVLTQDAMKTLADDLSALQQEITGKHLSQAAVSTLRDVLKSNVVQQAIPLAKDLLKTKEQFKTVSLAGGEMRPSCLAWRGATAAPCRSMDRSSGRWLASVG